MELYNIFNDLIGKLSNENCIKLGKSLIEYGKNDKQMEEELQMNKDLIERLIVYLLKDSKIKNTIINFLIQEKESLNDDINDIIYSDMQKDLTTIDLDKINNTKRTIQYIYDFIEKWGE